MKYPAVYIYKKTSDRGRELQFSLRSLANITNWNGQVFIIGHRETWLTGVTVIDAEKDAEPHIDRNNKLRAIVASKEIPDDFIFMNDDFYCTEPTELTAMYNGSLDTDALGNWATSKRETAKFLQDNGIESPLNYDIHTPILFNKQKLAEVLKLIGNTTLLPRSVYGNLFEIGGKPYIDRKTRTMYLPKAPFISTHLYTKELDKLFTTPSQFEPAGQSQIIDMRKGAI